MKALFWYSKDSQDLERIARVQPKQEILPPAAACYGVSRAQIAGQRDGLIDRDGNQRKATVNILVYNKSDTHKLSGSALR
jgi:hypothetical protein